MLRYELPPIATPLRSKNPPIRLTSARRVRRNTLKIQVDIDPSARISWHLEIKGTEQVSRMNDYQMCS